MHVYSWSCFRFKSPLEVFTAPSLISVHSWADRQADKDGRSFRMGKRVLFSGRNHSWEKWGERMDPRRGRRRARPPLAPSHVMPLPQPVVSMLQRILGQEHMLVLCVHATDHEIFDVAWNATNPQVERRGSLLNSQRFLDVEEYTVRAQDGNL